MNLEAIKAAAQQLVQQEGQEAVQQEGLEIVDVPNNEDGVNKEDSTGVLPIIRLNGEKVVVKKREEELGKFILSAVGMKWEGNRCKVEEEEFKLEEYGEIVILTTRKKLHGYKSQDFAGRTQTTFKEQFGVEESVRQGNRRMGQWSNWSPLDEKFDAKKHLDAIYHIVDDKFIPIISSVDTTITTDREELEARMVERSRKVEQEVKLLGGHNEERNFTTEINVTRLPELRKRYEAHLTHGNDKQFITGHVTFTNEGHVFLRLPRANQVCNINSFKSYDVINDEKVFDKIYIGCFENNRLPEYYWVNTDEGIDVAAFLNKGGETLEKNDSKFSRRNKNQSNKTYKQQLSTWKTEIDDYDLVHYIDDVVNSKQYSFDPTKKYTTTYHKDEFIVYEEGYPTNHRVLAVRKLAGYTKSLRLQPAVAKGLMSQKSYNDLARQLSNKITTRIKDIVFVKKQSEKSLNQQQKTCYKNLRFIFLESGVVNLKNPIANNTSYDELRSIVNFELPVHVITATLTEHLKKSDLHANVIKKALPKLQAAMKSEKLDNKVKGFYQEAIKTTGFGVFCDHVIQVRKDYKNGVITKQQLISTLYALPQE